MKQSSGICVKLKTADGRRRFVITTVRRPILINHQKTVKKP